LNPSPIWKKSGFIVFGEMRHEGIDVRGTDPDNTAYVSVICDLKGDDLKRKQVFFQESVQTIDINGMM